MALSSGIVRALAESESTFNFKNKGRSQQLGLIAEMNVVKLLKTKDWSLCFHLAKTDISEIDLIFEKNEMIVLIEVKKLNNSWRAFNRIDQKQINKLKTNLFLMRTRFKKINFTAYVAWVEPHNKISFVNIE